MRRRDVHEGDPDRLRDGEAGAVEARVVGGAGAMFGELRHGNGAARLTEEAAQVAEPLRVVKPDHLAVIRDRPVLALAPEDVLLWRDAASSSREEHAEQRDRGLGIAAARLVEGGDERRGGLDTRGELEETAHVVHGEPLTGPSTAGRQAR